MRTLSSSYQPIKPLFRWKDACHRTKVPLLPGSTEKDESSRRDVTPHPILRPVAFVRIFPFCFEEIASLKEMPGPKT